MKKSVVITHEQFSALFSQFDGIFMLHQQMRQRLNIDTVGSVLTGMVFFFSVDFPARLFHVTLFFLSLTTSTFTFPVLIFFPADFLF
jgi:hypothetical protein